MAQLKVAGKAAILLLVAGAGFGAYKYLLRTGSNLIPEAKGGTSKVVSRVDLPKNPGEAGYVAPTNITIPTSTAANINAPEMRLLHWAWNAQMGLMLANGGRETTQGSLMAKNGVNLKLIRQDDAAKMQEELVAFANALSKGESNPATGAHFVAIMGDGSAVFLKGVNDVLKKLGPEYRAKVIGSAGYSKGEDKFMGPAAWKANPKLAMGGVACGYLRDGDWNIAMKWLGDNGLRNNPDEKTYDPDALNWIAANDYLDAAEKYITGYSEDRPVVKNGRKTGDTKTIRVDSVVTWTPGDVNIATKKGGLVNIVSTREYSTQMPNTIIGIDKWMKSNRGQVEKMLDAIFKGGSMVRTSAEAITKAAEVSANVYGEQGSDAAYWEKYYKGVIERDKKGNEVELGGSSVNTLADNLVLFGMMGGGQNIFAATYTIFGQIAREQYPTLVPQIDPVDQILDTSYVQSLQQKSGATSTDIQRAKPTFDKTTPESQKRVVSKKGWKLEFETGKATFTPSAKAVLERMLKDMLIAGSLTVQIEGHTDNAGNPTSNMALSEARAFAVKSWLERRAPGNFPQGRISVMAYGQTKPVQPNTSAAGKAANRRVEVVMKAEN